MAPSQVTAEFWSKKSDLVIKELAVIPHTVLEERLRPVPRPFDATAPVTVGFLGASVPHKGWQEFSQRNDEPPCRTKDALCGVLRQASWAGEDTWHYVHVTAEAPDAMSKAIEGEGVDVVLHWASWPETFSFTTYEALSAGAWVLRTPCRATYRRLFDPPVAVLCWMTLRLSTAMLQRAIWRGWSPTVGSMLLEPKLSRAIVRSVSTCRVGVDHGGSCIHQFHFQLPEPSPSIGNEFAPSASGLGDMGGAD